MGIFARVTVGLKDTVHEMMHLIHIPSLLILVRSVLVLFSVVDVFILFFYCLVCNLFCCGLGLVSFAKEVSDIYWDRPSLVKGGEDQIIIKYQKIVTHPAYSNI